MTDISIYESMFLQKWSSESPKCIISLLQNPDFLTTPKKKDFEKQRRKRRKCWLPAFCQFPTVFSNLSKREIIILTTSNLSSANAFNLDQSGILSFDKELYEVKYRIIGDPLIIFCKNN